MKEPARFLLQGALGGALLQFLFSVIIAIAHPSIDALLALSILLIIPVIVGAAIGGILWLVKRRGQKDSGLFKRIVIGVIFPTLLFAITLYWGRHDWFWTSEDYEAWLGVSLFFGIEIGVPAAICARAKKTNSISTIGAIHIFPLLRQEHRAAR